MTIQVRILIQIYIGIASFDKLKRRSLYVQF